MTKKKYEQPVIVTLGETSGGSNCGTGTAPGMSDHCLGGVDAGSNCGTGTDAKSNCTQGNQARRDSCHNGVQAY